MHIQCIWCIQRETLERSLLESEFLSVDSWRRPSRSNPSIHWNPGREKVLNIAYRFRIYPTEEQKILQGKTFGCCRFLYNQMLNDKIKEYKKTKKMLKNTPAMYKKAYPFLKEVDSLALANVQLHLEKAYKNFFRDPKVGFPRFKSKHHSKNS